MTADVFNPKVISQFRESASMEIFGEVRLIPIKGKSCCASVNTATANGRVSHVRC